MEMKLTKKEKDQIIKRGAEAMSKIIERMSIEMGELEEEIKTLKEENEKLKSDLDECECSFGFENDEVGYRKREYKRLKKWIKDHCKGYGNLFLEDEMKRQRKKADKKRTLKSTYVYDAKQVRDVC